ncbi:MAG TPA: endolytic transglycosylase MltG [Marinagarivorans sp.]
MVNSTLSRLVFAIVVWLFIMVALAGFYLWQWLQTEQQVPQSQRVFVVEKGQTVGQVGEALAQRNLLRWPFVWRMYARFVQPTTLKAGEYALSPYESPVSLLTRLQGGEVISYNVTLAEGLTLKEWLALFRAEEKLKAVAVDMTAAQIANALGIDHVNPEGWFFPDTYRFEKGDSDLDILQRAYEKMQIVLAGQWARRQPSLPYSTAYEALIMASIIERETGVPHERPDIAGVFVRRLERNMRLQTDPTVIYGMGDRYEGRIRRVHLRENTPYNTYVIKGLPPTPIASPGREAIAAAVNPAAGDALYFVAKGDGSHHFSVTLDEHNKAVRKYQLNRRVDYSSTFKPSATSSSAASTTEDAP